MKGRILQMNYSKNTKKKKVRRIIFLWVMFFLLGILLGNLVTRALGDKQETAKADVIEIQTIAEPNEPKLKSLGVFKFTAYCPCRRCCGKWANGITATGTIATEGRTIAVDPKVIPLGSVVVIDGHEYIAEDVGGSIKQNRIDLYFNNHKAALNFGVQYKEVFVYE